MKANIRKGIKRIFRVLAWMGLALAFFAGIVAGVEQGPGLAFIIWIFWCPIFFCTPIGVGKLIFYIADGFLENEEG